MWLALGVGLGLVGVSLAVGIVVWYAAWTADAQD
jgi:F0F1-type ATP synthase membrane subunit c/vacuolar-type H+-ATPase subunit K